jgi:predicted O-methyltransferase YrrM
MASMITDPEIYFRQFIPERDELLLRLETEANAEAIPIVGPVVGELLFILARACRARRILELGTATGYSTIFLARGCEADQGHVVTVEVDPKMAARADTNIRAAGLYNQVQILNVTVQNALPGLSGPFDLVFMDIDKDIYATALPHCHRLLRSGGLLVADNTGFEDAGVFNQYLYGSDQWRSVQLYSLLPGHSPEQDGLALALRC